MDGNIKLNAKKILEKVFVPHGHGYDPEEVDAYLDEIIADYQSFERFYNESSKYIAELETSMRRYRERISELEVANAKMSKRLSGIKEGDSVSSENIEYISRIRRLENALYAKGIDPTKI